MYSGRVVLDGQAHSMRPVQLVALLFVPWMLYSSFLYVGPGPKGIGYKAMFKLEVSLEEAKDLAKIWSSWLKESHAGATKSGGAKKKSARRKKAR